MLDIEKKSDEELKFIGRLDASQAEKVAKHLSDKEETVTIDMSDLDYISSMGLNILVNTYKRLHENGHTVKLKNMNNHIRDIFKFTRLDQLFSIE